MAKLETQYENYLKEVPTSTYSFDEWLTEVWEPEFEELKDYVQHKKHFCLISIKRFIWQNEFFHFALKRMFFV